MTHVHDMTGLSYILHRASHILHLTSYILHPTSYILPSRILHRTSWRADLSPLRPRRTWRPSHILQVPLYMTALAIYEKTLGPEHPEVAKDLVNLGNAFCDQDQHSEAVPLYLRALAIDQAALGDEHPEVAMDLSNLGIVYRVQGRPDEATALFQRAHAIMLAALGPDDPKTHTVARNLASTLQPQLDASQPAAEHTREARAPPPHRPTAATPSAHPIATPSPHHRHTIPKGVGHRTHRAASHRNAPHRRMHARMPTASLCSHPHAASLCAPSARREDRPVTPGHLVVCYLAITPSRRASRRMPTRRCCPRSARCAARTRRRGRRGASRRPSRLPPCR